MFEINSVIECQSIHFIFFIIDTNPLARVGDKMFFQTYFVNKILLREYQMLLIGKVRINRNNSFGQNGIAIGSENNFVIRLFSLQPHF
jgi:hypothetical protein